MRLLVGLSLTAFGLLTGMALATPPDLKPKMEHWATSVGDMSLLLLPASFEGTYDSDNGRITGALGDGVWTGFWGEDSSGQECKTTLLGTKYWGRISFTFDKAHTHFEGKWGYCDDGQLSEDWTGDIAK